MRAVRAIFSLTTLGAAALLLTPPPASEAAAGLSIRWIPAHSSNYSRRSSRNIDRIVIHTIEGSESSGISWFQNSRSNVSAHYVVSHAGRITQMVRDNNVAWHAGRTNSRSIGIENEGRASRNGWTDVQYRQLAALVRSLCDRYRIPVDRTHLIGHSEVAGGRKVDPGRYFDWNRFLNLVRGGSAPVISTKSPPPNAAPAGRYAVEITASELRVRSGVWGSILGHAHKRDRFVVSDSDRGWLKIHYRGGTGWIHGNYAKHVPAQEQVEVTASALNARRSASTRSTVYAVTLRGQSYVVTGRDGGWIRIQLDQRHAWVFARYVRSSR